MERRPALAKKAHKKFSKAVRAQAAEQAAMAEVRLRLSRGWGSDLTSLFPCCSSTPRANDSYTSTSRLSFVLSSPLFQAVMVLPAVVRELSMKCGRHSRFSFLSLAGQHDRVESTIELSME